MRDTITTVTLNAAIDKTYFVPALVKGTVMRATEVLSMAGGKGVNVARVLHQLGHPDVVATGFAAGHNGRYLVDRIRESGIGADFVVANGESRLCLNFIDGVDDSSTEVLEPGPEVEAEHLAALKNKIGGLAERSAVVVLSGSLPRGAPPSLYAELIELVRAAGALPFLDASGAPLALGLSAMPAFIKPNEEEILKLLAGNGDGDLDLREGALALARQGIRNVVVTLGGEGAAAFVDGVAYRVAIPKLKAVNTVGCGDAFVAGYAYGSSRGWSAEACLRHAAAAGCANALSAVAGDVKKDDFDMLLPRISIGEWLK
ncbi:1-phosphofructokinase family hexose kinase [Cohnella suwonensis]|uniref:Tagatose-6-phosphate kinase n=1 Tax=Cohnella suwonensis TaxID=696072 RepID=A0ABW0LTU4_9BACL